MAGRYSRYNGPSIKRSITILSLSFKSLSLNFDLTPGLPKACTVYTDTQWLPQRHRVSGNLHTPNTRMPCLPPRQLREKRLLLTFSNKGENLLVI